MKSTKGHTVELSGSRLVVNGVEIGKRKMLSFFEQLCIQNYLVNTIDEIERILTGAAEPARACACKRAAPKAEPLDDLDIAEAEIDRGKRVPDWLFAKNAAKDDGLAEQDNWT